MRVALRMSLLAVFACLTFARSSDAQLTAISKWRTTLGNTGWNSKETILNRTTVGSGKFGKLWERKLDGQVYAQPLYLAGVTIPNKGTRNVVLVCTEHNSVYAFDADGGVDGGSLPLWQRSMGPPVPTDVVGCYDLWPEYGITSTPVIDVDKKVMFLTAKTLEDGQQTWRIHALDITTGDELPGWGRIIQGSVENNNGRLVTFTPEIQLNRSGLTLVNNRVYIAFGSHCDIRINEYRGWIFSYDAANPKTAPQILCVSPDSEGQREAAAGIWSAGASPAFDDAGNMFIMTGNGLFDVDLSGRNMGDSVVKINTQGGSNLSFSNLPQDYFTPSNQQWLTDVDADLGSGGLIAIPPQVGANTPNLLLGGGKDAQLRLMDRDNLGAFNGRINPNAPNNVLQEVPFPNGFWSSPAYFGGASGHYIYMNAVGDVLRQYRFGIDGNGDILLSPFAVVGPGSGYPSSTPVVSSDGGKIGTGVVWLLNRASNALHAYDADNIATLLYDSNAAGTRDQFGAVIKFTVPMVANGRVFVGADGKLVAFGANADIIERTDHYILAGPSVVNQNKQAIFQVSSLDKDGVPSPTMGQVVIEFKSPTGATSNLGPLRFNGGASKLFYRIMETPGTWTLTAAKGTTKQATFTVNVRASELTGIDHFRLISSDKAALGVPFGFIVVALDRYDHQLYYTGSVSIKLTRPNGTYLVSTPVVFNAQKTVSAFATPDTLGDAVLIATDGKHSGNKVVIVREASHLSGQAIPGDWVGHDRLRANIRLLDPFNHDLVVYSKTVILGDDFSFAIEVPSGVFDVSVKIDHWLQQIIRYVDTNSGPVLTFNGPEGAGMINGDTDNDNKVTDTDVANVQADLGAPPSGLHGKTDLNGDGIVDAADLAIVNKNNGKNGDK